MPGLTCTTTVLSGKLGRELHLAGNNLLTKLAENYKRLPIATFTLENQNMDNTFKILRTSRKIYADFLDNYSLEQLNKVPPGFNNNLIWNVGHIVVAQQSLIYNLSGLPMNVSNHLIDLYKPGTKPSGNTSPEEIEELRRLLPSLVDQTEIDLANGRFTVFTERMTRIGFHLTTFGEAMEFNNYHEGLHLGYMMSIKKFV